MIEAPTAQEALEKLHERYGVAGRIVELRRVHRGGFAGFFTREVVELHAAPPELGTAPTAGGPEPTAGGPEPTSSRPTISTAAAQHDVAPMSGGHGSPVDRLLDDEVTEAALDDVAVQEALAEPVAPGRDVTDVTGGPEVVDFATFLRAQLAASAAEPAAGAPAAGSDDALLAHAAALARQAIDRGATSERAASDTAGALAQPCHDTSTLSEPPTTADDERVRTAAGRLIERATATAAHTELDDRAAAAAKRLTERCQAASVGLAACPPTARDGWSGTEPPPSTEDGPAWSTAALITLGLPAGLVRGLDVGAAADDLAWTAALAGALRPLCRPLPSGASVLAGPGAGPLAAALQLPVIASGEAIRSTSASVATVVNGAADDERWLARLRETHWLHLTVGGRGWRQLFHLGPLAVSWSSPRDVCEAVRLASELGLVLGYAGRGPAPRSVDRARPLDVALVIRDLLPVQAAGPEARG